MTLPNPFSRAHREAVAALPGQGLLRLSRLGTALFVVAALVSALLRSLHLVAVVVSVVLFALGCVTFAMAFLKGADRSRTEVFGLGGWFFLQGSAPRAAQVELLGALAVQVVFALATAFARPFTDQAFVILAPMYGLGLTALWGARHGTFEPRFPTPGPPGAGSGRSIGKNAAPEATRPRRTTPDA